MFILDHEEARRSSRLAAFGGCECGAYKHVFGKTKYANESLELHKRTLAKAAKRIMKDHPKIKVDKGIMDLKGNVTVIT